MKGRLVILDEINQRRCAALMVDGKIEDLLVDGPDDTPVPGAIYRAVVDRQIKGQGGVFLRTSDGPAFLRHAKNLAPGQTLLVQVTGYAEPGKAIPVTSRLLFKSRFAIVTPGAPGINISRSIRDEDERERLLLCAHESFDAQEQNFGLIVRSAAASADSDAVSQDIESMIDLAQAVCGDNEGEPALLVDGPDAHMLAWRDWAEPAPDQMSDEAGSFDNLGVSDVIAEFGGPAGLPGGGFVYIESTRALVAVDVNTGPDTSLAAGLKANIAAARDLPRLLRLRGLGGQIVIDFAPMPKKERRQLEQILKSAFRSDSVDTTLVGWTPLGHYELTRKRERLPTPKGFAL